MVSARRSADELRASWSSIPQAERLTAFHELLDSLGIDHVWMNGPGTHFGDYWGPNLPTYLRFYAGAFAGGD